MLIEEAPSDFTLFKFLSLFVALFIFLLKQTTFSTFLKCHLLEFGLNIYIIPTLTFPINILMVSNLRVGPLGC